MTSRHNKVYEAFTEFNNYCDELYPLKDGRVDICYNVFGGIGLHVCDLLRVISKNFKLRCVKYNIDKDKVHKLIRVLESTLSTLSLSGEDKKNYDRVIIFIKHELENNIWDGVSTVANNREDFEDKVIKKIRSELQHKLNDAKKEVKRLETLLEELKTNGQVKTRQSNVVS